METGSNWRRVSAATVWLVLLALRSTGEAQAQQPPEPMKKADVSPSNSTARTGASSPEGASPAKPQAAETNTPDSPVPPPPDLSVNQESYGTAAPPPILIAPPPSSPPPVSADTPPVSLQSASEVIKVVLGLVLMFALAYLAGSGRVQALENKLQVTNVVTAGLPFVFLGVIAHMRGVGI